MIVCLFDIDGTLLHSGGAGKAALETALATEFGIEIRVRVAYSGRTDRAIIRDLFRHHDIPETSANLERLFQSYLSRLPNCLKNHQGSVLPGVLDLLETLRSRADIALGLLTGNVRAGALAKLGHFGLYEHFSFGGFGDRHFERDDVAREAFEAARHRLGQHIRSEQIWVIGDTPMDVCCARAIGAKAVAVATGIHPRDELAGCKPDLIFDNLADCQPLLAAWNSV